MKVAIVGAGIVGATAAYYLSKEPDIILSVFDDGHGQATKAAAGIISPWFSKRRHKAWYRMARKGADFYQELISDLKQDGYKTDFYQQSGVFVIKKRQDLLEGLYELALQRRQESPLIGDLHLLDEAQAADRFPGLTGFERLLYASGGARVEGASLTKTLLEASGADLIPGKVSLKKTPTGYQVADQEFDAVILAVGAWLPDILKPLGYEVAVQPQKGQLTDFQFDGLETQDMPVVMPDGEIDLIPYINGKVAVGASHENDQGYDLQEDQAVLQELKDQALAFYPALDTAEVLANRVGTRAYTPDFAPFYGEVPGLEKVYTASGLGSSGLTTGPLIAHELVALLTQRPGRLDVRDYPIDNYLKKETDQ